MLPVLIYASEAERSGILAHLNDCAGKLGQRFSVLCNTSSQKEALSCVLAEGGILFLVLDAGTDAAGVTRATELETRARERNRDSYCLYWLRSMTVLPELAAQCLRPVGFILPPPDGEKIEAAVSRVFEDYARLTDAPSDGFLTMQSGGTVYRIAVSSIVYIEALDKKLNIFTGRQCLTVYEKLGRLEEELGERFFRCHRSYLVSVKDIESVDFAAMELRLTGDVRLPVSRSSKNGLKAILQRGA